MTEINEKMAESLFAKRKISLLWRLLLRKELQTEGFPTSTTTFLVKSYLNRMPNQNMEDTCAKPVVPLLLFPIKEEKW